MFDLPQVIEFAERAGRLEIVAGSHPAKSPPVRRSGRDEARILVVEGVIPDNPTAGDASFDLFMLTLGGGRQRTVNEFKRLAESVDLELRSSRLLEIGNSLLELRG